MSARASGVALFPVEIRPAKPGTPLEARIWARVDRRFDDECWEWLGTLGTRGYGYFSWKVDGHTVTRQAHRLVYELVAGPIPAGLELDHSCRNPRCVNPAHLEAVTHLENMRRAKPYLPTGTAHWSGAKTHCLRGHPFDTRNTYVTAAGKRACRSCERLRKRRRGVLASESTANRGRVA